MKTSVCSIFPDRIYQLATRNEHYDRLVRVVANIMVTGAPRINAVVIASFIIEIVVVEIGIGELQAVFVTPTIHFIESVSRNGRCRLDILRGTSPVVSRWPVDLAAESLFAHRICLDPLIYYTISGPFHSNSDCHFLARYFFPLNEAGIDGLVLVVHVVRAGVIVRFERKGGY